MRGWSAGNLGASFLLSLCQIANALIHQNLRWPYYRQSGNYPVFAGKVSLR
jgi:hypothetical protein